MYCQRAELPRDNTACRTMPLLITQQLPTDRQCNYNYNNRGEEYLRETPLRWSGFGCMFHCSSSSLKFSNNHKCWLWCWISITWSEHFTGILKVWVITQRGFILEISKCQCPHIRQYCDHIKSQWIHSRLSFEQRHEELLLISRGAVIAAIL